MDFPFLTEVLFAMNILVFSITLYVVVLAIRLKKHLAAKK